MRVTVAGLWHLGSVTAACLASAGHDVVAYDANERTTADLNEGKPPLFEPGLADLVARGLQAEKLRFTSDGSDAVGEADVIWVAYDTPVDDDDRADVEFVKDAVKVLLPLAKKGTLVLISSQLPVGSTRALEAYAAEIGRNDLSFGCSPENLRLGKAIEVFTRPDRVVVGLRRYEDRERVAAMLAPFTDRIEWMSVESAEMTKHALNAFLATSVSFINEIATICEHVGADAREVERGLKSERRIGPGAYLGPGGAFAGGTLARDLVFLYSIGQEAGLPTSLISGVKASNDAHRRWQRRRLSELLEGVRGKRIAIWGLTYKPGTDTLRRSSAVELADWLLAEGAGVTAHDPAVKTLPAELSRVALQQDAISAADGADALVIMTEWPDYRNVDVDALARTLGGRKLVLDANRFLVRQIGDDSRFTYVTVGKAV